MGRGVVDGIEEGLSVFVPLVTVAIASDFLKLDTGYDEFWIYLDNLGIINFFDEEPLNGLAVLGLLLGLIVLVLALFFPDKKKDE